MMVDFHLHLRGKQPFDLLKKGEREREGERKTEKKVLRRRILMHIF